MTDSTDPYRHWDGQRWLRWDGAAWVPEVQEPQHEVEEPASDEDTGKSRRESFAEIRTRKEAEKAAKAQAKQLEAATKPPRSVTVQNSTYLGGLPGDRGKKTGNLYVDAEKIGVGFASAKHGLVLWSDATGVSYSGGQVAKSKVGAELMFGVLGGLGAKGSADRAEVVVFRRDGSSAFFQVDKISRLALKAKLAPLLAFAGVPCVDDQPITAPPQAAPAVPDPAEQLLKLAQLRDAGIVSDEEFAAKKAEILGRM